MFLAFFKRVFWLARGGAKDAPVTKQKTNQFRTFQKSEKKRNQLRNSPKENPNREEIN